MADQVDLTRGLNVDPAPDPTPAYGSMVICLFIDCQVPEFARHEDGTIRETGRWTWMSLGGRFRGIEEGFIIIEDNLSVFRIPENRVILKRKKEGASLGVNTEVRPS